MPIHRASLASACQYEKETWHKYETMSRFPQLSKKLLQVVVEVNPPDLGKDLQELGEGQGVPEWAPEQFPKDGTDDPDKLPSRRLARDCISSDLVEKFGEFPDLLRMYGVDTV
jgi:hypothetical protein